MAASDLASYRVLSQPDCEQRRPDFIVGAMMTASHAHFGARLAASCRRFELPLVLVEVPTVHHSISPKGSDDLRYTKANFVRYLLERWETPVLYVDVDCVFAEPPVRVRECVRGNVDFAIFNWLAEAHNEAYLPVDASLAQRLAPRSAPKRFYRFSHRIEHASTSQLLCSGLVQFYGHSAAALRLLERWQRVIERVPHGADDKCLDLAFNNYAGAPALRAAWLDKSYARYAWWIYQRPVIDHPEFPHTGSGFVPLDEIDGEPRIHRSRLELRRSEPVFPKHCVIDAEQRVLLRLEDGAWHAAGAVTVPLYR